jgi:hypothetical protein
MATTQHGDTLIIGAGTLTGYIVDTKDDGDVDVAMEEIEDGSDGSLATILVFRRDVKTTYNLIALSSAAPATDFPKGAKCGLTGLTSLWVDDCRISSSKGAQRVTVTLVNKGITLS